MGCVGSGTTWDVGTGLGSSTAMLMDPSQTGQARMYS